MLNVYVIIAALTVVGWLCAAPVACAWGLEGHAIVARIAENHLTPDVRRTANAMLDGGSLASVSYWADEIRPNRRETSRWHFINFLEDTTGYDASRDCKLVQYAEQGRRAC